MSRASDPVFVGIDKGTSTVKTTLFSLDGALLGESSRRTPLISPRPGWHEEDMETVWRAACETVREATANRGVAPSAVAGIGVTGHMAGLFLVDAAGRPVRPGIEWTDSRAGAFLAEVAGTEWERQQFAISGNALVPGLTLVLLRWLRDHEPEALGRARHLLFAKDWIRFRLTGEIATDVSEIGWMPGDVRRRDYSPDLLDMLGLDDVARLFPPVLGETDIAGAVTAAAAEATGLAEGTPVVVGQGDAIACNLGAGALRPRQAVSVLGTSFLNQVVTSEPLFEPDGLGCLFPSADGTWTRILPNTGGGTVNLQWFLDHFCEPELAAAEEAGGSVYELVGDMVGEVPVGSGGVLFQPFVNTSGVVAPFYHTGARAGFFGLSVDTDKAHVLRAIFEGVGYAMADCYQAMPVPPSEIRLSGGGSRSRVWAQILADVTDTPIVVPDQAQASAKGAALLAAIGTGYFSSQREAADATVGVSARYRPDRARAEQYRELVGLYRDLRVAMMSAWSRRQQILAGMGHHDTGENEA